MKPGDTVKAGLPVFCFSPIVIVLVLVIVLESQSNRSITSMSTITK